MKLTVLSVRQLAETIRAYELGATDGYTLPSFSAGSHLTFNLPNGLTRSYSLCGRPYGHDNYVVAVNLAEDTRGGSAYWFDAVRPGHILEAEGPQNNFPLGEDVPHTTLFAGGVGITPIWSMVQRLDEIGASWELHYGVRTPQHAAFLEDLESLTKRSKNGNATVYYDDARNRTRFDMRDIIESSPTGSHFYCCGPEGMLDAFMHAAQGISPERVHIERFASATQPQRGGAFVVYLARAGIELAVPGDKSILDVLLDAGIDVPYSCKEGICASCETRVLDGVPQHRDSVLTPEEKVSNKVMMLCCSGAITDRLVLDL